MELRHIRYFLAVAAESNFTRAAEKLGIGQPPLSQQIKALEAEVGARLFHRLSHGAELTEAGAVFLAGVRDIPAAAAEAARLARRAAAGETGTLRLGLTGTAALTPIVPACMRAFRRAYPEVEFVIEEANSIALLSAIADGRLDAAMLRPSASDPEEIAEEHMAKEPLVAALPAAHPLAAGAAAVDLARLREDAFIVTPRDIAISLREAALAACREAGFEPRMGPPAPQIASIFSLVAAELGVSLVPASMGQINVAGVVLKPLARAPHTVDLTLAYRKATTAVVVRHFVQTVRQVVREARRAEGETIA